MRIVQPEELTQIVGGKKSLTLIAAATGATIGLITGGLGSAVGNAVKFGAITYVVELIAKRKRKKNSQ